MSKIENLTVNVAGNYDHENPIVIHLLEGPAPQPVKTAQPSPITITGDIFTPVNYSSLLPEQVHNPENAIVRYSVNPKNPFIKLIIRPNCDIRDVITGELAMNKDLEAFRFNEAGSFNNKSFADLIMKYPHCFATKGEAKSLRKALQNYQARFNSIVSKADDSKGNTEDLIKTEFDRTGSGIPESIHLHIPIFDGGPAVDIIAEVEIDVQMSSGKPEARFAFFTESIENEKRNGVAEIIKNQIDILRKKFICIRENN